MNIPNAKSQGETHELLQEVESIESILARDHDPAEVQQKVEELLEALEKGDIFSKRAVEIAILCQSRGKIKALLSHSAIQGDGHEKTRASLEKIAAMLNPVEAIGKMYGYKPYPETVERLDLGVNWHQMEESLADLDMRRFDQITTDSDGILQQSNKLADFWKKGLFKCEVESNQEKSLKLEVIKSIRKLKESGKVGESLLFSLDNPNFSKGDLAHTCVGNFALEKIDKENHTEWDMNDRIVGAAYRDQNVASKMLGMAEQMISKYGKEVGRPQEVVASVGQVNVLVWLLKQGYVPTSDEDQERLDRLMRGDELLTIASAPGDEKEDEKREWYMFEKSKLLDENGQHKAKVWDRSLANYRQADHYMVSSFRIRLKHRV